LSDLDWSEVKSFLETIPTEIERVGLLNILASLPDDGIINNTIVDPPRHRRNDDLFLITTKRKLSITIMSFQSGAYLKSSSADY
jgi:hypothetical protein